MSLHSRRGLISKLSNKRYRNAFVAARISQTLAIQLRVLRQRAGLSQPDLARELGTSQNAVSRMESPMYGKQSISTLKKLAAYFDVGLIVRLAPFSEIMDWTLSLKEGSVAIPDFAHDNFNEDCVPILADTRRIAAHGLTSTEAMEKPQSTVGYIHHGAVPSHSSGAATQSGLDWPPQSSGDLIVPKPAGAVLAAEQRMSA